MIYLHLLMAILSVWRITELFTQDRITDSLRKKFPTYLWQCPRCMSVWAAVYATAAFAVFPWANWPFALAWIYLTHNEFVATRRMALKGRTLTVTVTPKGEASWRNELTPTEVQQILPSLLPRPNGPVTPAN